MNRDSEIEDYNEYDTCWHSLRENVRFKDLTPIRDKMAIRGTAYVADEAFKFDDEVDVDSSPYLVRIYNRFRTSVTAELSYSPTEFCLVWNCPEVDSEPFFSEKELENAIVKFLLKRKKY